MTAVTLFDCEQFYASDENLKREEVLEILKWTKTQLHLPEMTEQQAMMFLHSCYYQKEPTKITIENYFTGKTKYADLFECPPEDIIKSTSSVGFAKILPRKTPNGDIIFLMKLLDTRPSAYNCLNHTKMSLMAVTLYIYKYGPGNGLIFLFDMEGGSFGHLFKMNLLVTKRMMWFLQEASPVRIRALHFINLSPVTGKLMSIMKPFMKKEVADSIKLHSTSLESLYEYVPKECLPEDYKGELPSVQTLNEERVRELLENLDFFQWHSAQKVNESKRL